MRLMSDNAQGVAERALKKQQFHSKNRAKTGVNAPVFAFETLDFCYFKNAFLTDACLGGKNAGAVP